MINPQIFLEALLLTSALSLDAFVSGFAYGTNKIKIPFLSAMIINLTCGAILAASLFLGTYIGQFVPQNITLIVCVIILVILGLVKIFDSLIKNYIKKKQGINKEIKFSVFSLKFILNIYAKPEDADSNRNKILLPKEALALALALSLDGLTVGLGAGLMNQSTLSYVIIISFSLIIDFVFLLLGKVLGNKLAKKTSLNFSWLGGIILIGLAFMKIFI